MGLERLILLDSLGAERGEPLREEEEIIMLICEKAAGSELWGTMGSVACGSATR